MALRPMNPEDLRAYVRSQVRDSPLATNAWTAVAAIEGLFAEDELSRLAVSSMRHMITKYLLGKGSSKGFTASEVSIINRWTQDQDNARIEAWRVVNRVTKEAGQRRLWDEE